MDPTALDISSLTLGDLNNAVKRLLGTLKGDKETVTFTKVEGSCISLFKFWNSSSAWTRVSFSNCQKDQGFGASWTSSSDFPITLSTILSIRM